LPDPGSFLELVLIHKVLSERIIKYLTPLIASGKVDMEKAMKNLKDAIFVENGVESKRYMKKAMATFEKVKDMTISVRGLK